MPDLHGFSDCPKCGAKLTPGSRHEHETRELVEAGMEVGVEVTKTVTTRCLSCFYLIDKQISSDWIFNKSV